MPVNPNEAPDGFVAVELQDFSDCGSCHFEEIGGPACEMCGAQKDRADGCQVMFVRKSNMATANWPHDDMGTPV